MNPDERIANWKHHPSMRGQFGFEFYKLMAKDERVWCLTGDLGFGLLDAHRDDFPERYLNCGASEQAMIGIGVGLALQGKIPFCYSITPFLLYRPFEWLRNYLHHEHIPVKLVGSGLNDDYKHDGFTHDASDALEILKCLSGIVTFLPSNNPKAISLTLEPLAYNNEPTFIALRR